MGIQRTYIILALFICVLLSCAGTVSAATYSGGSGTIGDPYLLSSDSDIDTLSSTSADWGKNFTLTQNITLVGNHTPIGNASTKFTGEFDGNGFAVMNLTVYNTGMYSGFFGYAGSGANIHDLGVEASSNGVYSVYSYAGVLVGYNSDTVSNCYATGDVTLENGEASHGGGLVGYNAGTVNNSYATGNVSGGSSEGGLVGYNYGGSVNNSYATGNVTCYAWCGGLVGCNNGGSVINSFATGAASSTGSGFGIGGLVGNDVSGTVSNSWYSGTPVAGDGNPSSYDNFTSFEFVSGSSGLNWNASGNIITTADDSSFIWMIVDGSSLPYLQYQYVIYSGGSGTVDEPYLLSTDSDIDYLSATPADWGKNFTLIQDITLVGNHTPIGNLSSQFTGNFNGSGYAIQDLTVYQSSSYAGFFGYAGSAANIHDLGIETSSEGVVSTGSNVGVLVGTITGAVTNCYATGNVTGSSYVGGLAGYSDGAISNSYAAVDVIGSSDNVGGLVGRNNGIGGTVTNCYTTGNATGNSKIGCLVGFNGGVVTNSFATGAASGSGSNIGGLLGDNTWGTLSNSWYSGSPTDSSGTSSSFVNFTSFTFVSGNTGLYWNENGNNITTSDDPNYAWKIISGYTLPYFQYQDTPDPLAPYVETISQSSGSNNTNGSSSLWVNVTGACFNITDTVFVNLTMSGQTPINGTIDSISYTTINTTFNLTQAIAGDWSLYVINPDGQTSTAKAFTVQSLADPGTPSSFTNTTGNYWVSHSWTAGTGDVTDSYNVSYNGSWLNGTTNGLNHTGLSAHAWSNITVYAYNATDCTLSDGVMDNVLIPNNEISILNVTNISTSEGESISFDINFTDADGDTSTFNCNRSSLFDSFNTSTGEGSWDIGFSDAGIYHIEFNVSDGYGSVDSHVMNITVANTATIYVGNGSEFDFSTIQAAVNDASEGDTTIVVTDGTYTENVDVNKELTIRSQNGSASTTVQALSNSDDAFDVTADNVTICGFYITGVNIFTGAGIYLDSVSNCTIANNSAIGNYNNIYLTSSDNNELINNNASNTYYGIWLASSDNNTLTNNIANNAEGYGICLQSAQNNTLGSNTANVNSDHGIYLYSSSNFNTLTENTANVNSNHGIYLSSSSNNTLTDNTINENTKSGIYLSSSSNNTLNGNVANENTEYGIAFISSYYNTIVNSTAMNNAEYDIVTNRANVINDLSIIENGAGISLLSDSIETGIKGNASNSTSLTGKINVNGYFTVVRSGVLSDSISVTGRPPAPDINVSYDDTGMSSSSESSIDLYKYTDNTWTAVSGTSLNTSIDQITATLAEGTFALFKDPEPSTSTDSSDDDSSTRASVSQGQNPTIVENSASSVIRVTGDSNVDYDFSDSGTPVLGVSFEAKEDKGLVVAKVQVLSSAPEDVPASSGTCYQTMSIDVGSEGTISSGNADNIRIRFKVSKQWIEENNIDVSTIRMTRHNGGQWNDLPTYQEREEGEYIYFYAETPGFSIFEIVGDEVGEVPEPVPEPQSIVEEETEPVEEEETKDTPGFTALAGVVVVSLAFLMSREQK